MDRADSGQESGVSGSADDDDDDDEHPSVAAAHLQAGVGPAVVGAPLARDAASGAALTLVPKAHPPLLGLLEDLDLRLSH